MGVFCWGGWSAILISTLGVGREERKRKRKFDRGRVYIYGRDKGGMTVPNAWQMGAPPQAGYCTSCGVITAGHRNLFNYAESMRASSATYLIDSLHMAKPYVAQKHTVSHRNIRYFTSSALAVEWALVNRVYVELIDLSLMLHMC